MVSADAARGRDSAKRQLALLVSGRMLALVSGKSAGESRLRLPVPSAPLPLTGQVAQDPGAGAGCGIWFYRDRDNAV